MAWTGGYSAGDSAATETSNPSVSPNPLQLFTVSGHGDAAAGLVARVGVRITSSLAIEVEGQFSRPVLSASLGQDYESASPVTATETFNEVLVGGSAVWRLAAKGRVVPFVSGGAAYVHLMTAESSAVASSSELHGGGGLELVLKRRLALRVDARLSAIAHPLGFNTPRRYVPQAIATVVYRR